MADISIALEDGMELAEMLQFLADWLANADPAVRASFDRFVGADGYPLEQMCHDLRRFVFLLGAADGEELFGEGQFEPEF